MSAPHDDQGPDGRPDPVPIAPARKSGFSLVWLVPVAALAVALGAAWRNYSERGPLITVSFGNAAGVAADETELRFRDIAVGYVEAVSFSDTLDRVEVDIRVDPEIAPFVDDGARFWVVRPEVTAQGVTGLDTVLSGVYIQGAWDGESGAPQNSFTGFDSAPLLRAGETGTTFRMVSDDTMPAAETPILFKGVQVGRVAGAEIAEGGLSVGADAVVFAPYDDLVTTETRFWDISGFSLSIGAEGAGLDFTSLSSLIAGGITFDTLGSGGAPLSEGMVYDLHPDAETAREDFFLEGDGTAVDLLAVFDDNLSGLRTGAPVELGGLRVGEVASIAGIVDAARFGDSDVRLATTLRINPGRIGLGEDADAEELLAFLDDRAADGLRARLTNASLLTGGLKVDLIELPDAPAASVDRDARPFPAIPTAPAEVANIAASAQGVLSRVDALPIEELMQAAIGFLEESRALVGADETQALPAQVGALAGDLAASAARLDGLLAQVETEGTVIELTAALRNVGEAAAGVPALSEAARALLADLGALPLDALVTRAETVLATADSLMAQDAVRALPGDLSAALSDLRGLVGSARAVTDDPALRALPAEATALAGDLGGAVGRVDALLRQLDEAGTVTRLTQAIDDVARAADGLPALTDQASAILTEASDLPLQELATRAAALLDAAEGVLGQDSTRAVPAALNGALAELQGTLAALREGGAVQNVNAALLAARDAAVAISEASAELPALSRRLSVAADQAGTTLAGFDRDSSFSRDLAAAIRQIDSAADAVEALARQLQRNPSSLITGR